MELVLIPLYLGFAIAIGAAANARGRSGFGWFVLAILISPILSGLLLLLFPTRERGPTRVCPKCAETVKAAAKVCRYCGASLPAYKPSANIGVGGLVVGATVVVVLVAGWVFPNSGHQARPPDAAAVGGGPVFVPNGVGYCTRQESVQRAKDQADSLHLIAGAREGLTLPIDGKAWQTLSPGAREIIALALFCDVADGVGHGSLLLKAEMDGRFLARVKDGNYSEKE